jgi:hypothetical protein
MIIISEKLELQKNMFTNSGPNTFVSHIKMRERVVGKHILK